MLPSRRRGLPARDARRAHRGRRGRVDRGRRAARRRRLGRPGARRHRRPACCPSRPRPRAVAAARCGARHAVVGRRLVLPRAVRPRRAGREPGRGRRRRRVPRRGAVGPRLDRPRHQRHLGAAALAPDGPRRASRAPPRPPPAWGRAAATPGRRARDADAAAGRPRSAAAGRWCRRGPPMPRCAPPRSPRGCSTGTASSPAARSRPSACPAGSPASTACCRRSRTPGAAGAATSSRASAPRSSRCRARSTACAPRCPTGRDPSTRRRARWCSPPPIPPTRTARRSAGPHGPRTSRAATRPGRKAGALVVLVDGALVLYVERGGRTLLSWTDDEAVLAAAAAELDPCGEDRRARPAHGDDRGRRLGAGPDVHLGQGLGGGGIRRDPPGPPPPRLSRRATRGRRRC